MTLLAHERCYVKFVSLVVITVSLHELCTYVLPVILYVLKDLYRHLVAKIALGCPCEQHQSSTTRDLNNLCLD